MKVTVFGTGYVGLVQGAVLADVGHHVMCVDVDAAKKILEDNYGRKEKDKEAVVKKLYDELNLEKRYKDYEEKVVTEIKDKIAKIDESEGLKKGIFEAFLAKIYKRSK